MAGNTTCKHIRLDGSGCQSRIVMPSGYCHVHDPERRATLRDVSAKGGRGKSRSARAGKLVPAVLRPVLDQLLEAMPAIADGSLDPRQASAMASVAGAITRVYQAGTLEERLQALEAQQGGSKGA